MRLDVTEHVRLDGVLDEPLWEKATPVTGFRQQEPNEGLPATEETVVRIVYDRDNLYIGVLLYDRNPQGIIAFQKQRDASLDTDDRFAWILDTSHDGRTGYVFEINPAGLMADALLGQADRFQGVNRAWDGIWEAQVKRDDRGWAAEIRIPFRTLNFDHAGEAWGINFQRTIRRKNEEVLWSGHRRNQGLYRPVYAGTLTGIHDVSQGLGIEATPYGLGGWSRSPVDAEPSDIRGDFGADVTYNVTASLRAALTVNTDFAEVEIDQRQVNLTRFPLFFPERRDFFLEGSGVYTWPSRTTFNPYFSRRIGLVEGQPVPIRYGLRLGGHEGAYEIGLQQLRTGAGARHEGEDFTVARIKRQLLGQSTIGALYTRRAGGDTANTRMLPDRHTLGADLELTTTRFLTDQNLSFETFFTWHSDPNVAAGSGFTDRSSWGLRLSYPNDVWNGMVSYRVLGDDFAPAVGFTPRNGFRRLRPSLNFQPRPSIPGVRQLQFGVAWEHLTDLSNRLQTREVLLRVFGARMNSGDEFAAGVTERFERLDAAFEIHDGVVIPAGEYGTVEWWAQGSTARHRRIAGRLEARGGEFWSGNQLVIASALTFRPASGVSFSAEFEHNDVDLAEGSFATNLFRLTGGWHASPWISWNSTVQYDDVSNVIGLNVRLRWILRPGSDLYVVYNHNWRSLGRRLGSFELETLSQSGATKISYTYRF